MYSKKVKIGKDFLRLQFLLFLRLNQCTIMAGSKNEILIALKLGRVVGEFPLDQLFIALGSKNEYVCFNL